MDKQQKWLDWIRNLPKWVTGTITLATAIIGFVILFQKNYYLGSTVLGFLLLGAVLCLFIYIAFVKTPPLVEGGKGVYRYEKFRRWAFVGIGFVLVVIAAAFALKSSRSFVITAFIGTATPTNTATPTLAPIIEGEPFADGVFGILIADFCDGIPEPTCNASASGRELAALVESELQRRLSRSSSLAEKVKTQRVGVIASPEDAAAAGLQLRATLVIWGWILSTEDNAIAARFIPVNPVINVDADNVGGLIDALWVDATITGGDAVQVGTQVALRASVAAKFITGFLLMLDNNMLDAAAEFNQAIDETGQSLKALPVNDPRRIEAERGLAALYLFRGITLAVLSDSYVLLDAERPGVEDESRADFKRAIELNPNLAVAYVNLGNLDFVRQDHGSAKAYYLKALSIDPKVASTYIGLGNLAFTQANYNEALDYYNEALQWAGDRGREAMQARYLRGLAYTALGEFKEATKDFEYILGLEAAPVDLHYLSERKLEEIRDPDVTPALEVITPIATPMPLWVTPWPTFARP